MVSPWQEQHVYAWLSVNPLVVELHQKAVKLNTQHPILLNNAMNLAKTGSEMDRSCRLSAHGQWLQL